MLCKAGARVRLGGSAQEEKDGRQQQPAEGQGEEHARARQGAVHEAPAGARAQGRRQELQGPGGALAALGLLVVIACVRQLAVAYSCFSGMFCAVTCAYSTSEQNCVLPCRAPQ